MLEMEMEREYPILIDSLRRLLKSPKSFDEAIALARKVHAVTHTAAVSSSAVPTYCDILLDGLNEEDFRIMPTKKDETIAWHFWHIARIEDLVGNLLIAEQPQIFSAEWMGRMQVSIRDTGNAMTDPQILDFSKQVNKQELLHYRDAVGSRTQDILAALSPGDLKRKPGARALELLVSEGGLLENKKSIWLRDFWGKHTAAGLILLPLTRHHMMHLPDSFRIKVSVHDAG